LENAREREEAGQRSRADLHKELEDATDYII
jgi:hypothetical protein